MAFDPNELAEKLAATKDTGFLRRYLHELHKRKLMPDVLLIPGRRERLEEVISVFIKEINSRPAEIVDIGPPNIAELIKELPRMIMQPIDVALPTTPPIVIPTSSIRSIPNVPWYEERRDKARATRKKRKKLSKKSKKENR